MSCVSKGKGFIGKGNVLGHPYRRDFGKIVTSLTNVTIMFRISMLASGIAFKEKFFALNDQ